MKKENRKLAQQRRAEERKKKEFRRKVSKVIAILIPIVVIAAIIAIFAVYSKHQSGSSSSSQSETTDAQSESSSTETESEETDSYSTDSSLTVEDGDTVNIDYVGSVDGVEFSGGNTNGAGADLTIGSNTYIDDFEEQLIGSHPGDVVNVNVTFPDPYSGNPDLSGKEALFVVTVNGIYK